MRNYKFRFIAGSQDLYGEETLRQVRENSREIAAGLSAALPYPLEYITTVKTAEDAVNAVRAANADAECAGIVVFCHTFSPSKMWINALALLQKPYLHLHTQFLDEIPNDGIDMDYMNLHQSAHGDREHAFIAARLRLPRKIVVGYWKDAAVRDKIARWQRAAVGAAFSRSLKVMRFGDNMREVAVTEGDKVDAQLKFGWQVNTWPVGTLAERAAAVAEHEIDALVDEYRELYEFNTDDVGAVRYQAREELAIRAMLGAEGCGAFTTTFQDLHGLSQLPGLASQRLMSLGYGFGAEGDWKIAALTAVIKAMSGGGASFIEDYTYDLKSGLSLGAHMLEVCPSIAADTPRIEVHPLGIGGKKPPARLVFNGKAGKAMLSTLVDMGGRFRLIVHDVDCVAPNKTMPNLPVARVMWRAEPSLELGAECWLLAGGAHHSVLSYDTGADILRDWARIMDVEFVHISGASTPESLERELFINDLAWRLK